MFRLRILILALAGFGILAVPAVATPRHADPYSLTAVALLGSDGTDVYLTVSSSTGSVPSESLAGAQGVADQRPTISA